MEVVSTPKPRTQRFRMSRPNLPLIGSTWFGSPQVESVRWGVHLVWKSPGGWEVLTEPIYLVAW